MSNQPIILPAIVKYEAREPKQTTRGPRINVKVTLENGQYFDPAPGTPDAGTAQNTPQAPQKPQADVSSLEAVEALQKRAHVLTGLYLDIYAKLIEGDPDKPFGSGINKEDLSSAAATIFIQVCRG
jgi:hypothetical protein